jgi:steroid delta-isomerase-like uncharacterized protein
MSTEENKAIFRRYIDEFISTGNLAKADEFISPDYVGRPSGTRGPDGYRQLLTRFRTAFPDFRVTIEDLTAEDDVVACFATWSGTHVGEWLGVPPTGKSVSWRASMFRRIRDGKLVEGWGTVDNLALLRQFGAVIAPPVTG